MTKKRGRLLPFVLVIALLTTLFVPTTLSAQEEKSITISFLEEPNNLNPLYTDMWFSWLVWDLNLAGLWNIDNEGNFIPELVEELPSIENGGMSEDGLTVTLKLRDGLKWSDGEPLTAEDFVFTYEMKINDGNTVSSRYPYDTYFDSVVAVDDRTVQINLTEAYMDWSTTLFVRDSRVMPEHILGPVFEAEGTLDNADWNFNQTVGSGPFVLREWVSGSHMILDANPNYWRGDPALDTIYIRFMPDREAQLNALKAGDSDIGSYILGDEIPALEEVDHIGIQTAFSGYQQMIFINMDPETANPGMTDVRVRQALIMAIDRQLIIDELFYGLYDIPTTYWHNTPFDNPELEPWPYDPEAATALLDEAGWMDSNGDGVREKDGVDLVLRFSAGSGSEIIDAQAVVMQQMLSDVGIRMDINNMSTDLLWAGYADDGPIATGQYELTQWSDGMWYFPSPDTSYFLCDEIPSDDYPDGYNWFGVCIPEMDELFQQKAVAVDLNERIDLFHEIGKIMHDQVIYIPMRSDPDVWAVNTRLENVRFSGANPFMFAFEWDTSE